MNFHITQAYITDAEEILNLQKRAYVSEAKIINNFSIPPLIQTLSEIKKEFKEQIFLKLISENKITGSLRFYEDSGTCFIGKLIVDPKVQNQGLGTALMNKIHSLSRSNRFELFTGSESKKNLIYYKKLGYIEFKKEVLDHNLTFVFLEKIIKVRLHLTDITLLYNP